MGKDKVDIQVGDQIYTVEVDANATEDEIRRGILAQIGGTQPAAEARGIRPSRDEKPGGPSSVGYVGPIGDATPEAPAPEATAPSVQEQKRGTKGEGDIGFYQDDQPFLKLPADFNKKYNAFARKAAAEGNLTGSAIRVWAAANYPGLNISNADQIAEAFAKTKKLNTSGAIVQKPPAIRPEGDFTPLEAAGRGFAKTGTASTLPALAAAYNVATGEAGDFRAELDRQLAVQAGYEQEHPGWSFAGQAAGYFLPWARAGGAPGTAAFSGLHGLFGGYQESGGDPVAAVTRAITEGTLGFGTDVLGQKAAAALKAKYARPPQIGPGERAYQSAEELGIRLPATLTSPTAASLADRGAMTAIPIAKAETRAVQETGEKLSDIAQGFLPSGQQVVAATPADIKVGMGETLVRGATNWIKNTGNRASKLYQDAQRLSQGAIIPPHETRAVLSDELLNLNAMPNLNQSQISIVQDVFDDLVKSPGGVQSLRDIRTALWNRLSAGDVALTTSQKGALVSRISAAISKDIENGLTNLTQTTGDPRFVEALSKFQKGNALWKQRADMTQNVLAKILGKEDPNEIIYAARDVWDTNVSPQQAAEVLQRFTKRDHGDLVRTMSVLDDSGKGDVRASLINMLGSNKSGDFDPKTFMMNLDAIPTKTQEALFGKEGVRSLRNIRNVADVLVNPLEGRGARSNFARAAKLFEVLGIVGMATKGAVEGGVTGAGTSALAAGTIAGGLNWSAARILASPQLSRYAYLLSKATNSENRYNIIQQITRFAARNPDLSDASYDLIRNASGFEGPIEGPLVGREPKPEEKDQAAQVDEAAQITENVANALNIGPQQTSPDQSQIMIIPQDGTQNPVMIGEVADEGNPPFSDGKASVAERNNNPGNLIVSAWTKTLPGYIGPGEGKNEQGISFAKFDTMQAGQDAKLRLVVNKINKGYRTPRALVESWLSPTNARANPEVFRNYVKHVSERLGIGPNEEIKQGDIRRAAQAIYEFESGDRP